MQHTLEQCLRWLSSRDPGTLHERNAFDLFAVGGAQNAALCRTGWRRKPLHLHVRNQAIRSAAVPVPGFIVLLALLLDQQAIVLTGAATIRAGPPASVALVMAASESRRGTSCQPSASRWIVTVAFTRTRPWPPASFSISVITAGGHGSPASQGLVLGRPP